MGHRDGNCASERERREQTPTGAETPHRNGPDQEALTVQTVRNRCLLRGEPALTTEEIAEELGLPEKQTQRALELLEATSELQVRSIEGAYLWWVNE